MVHATKMSASGDVYYRGYVISQMKGDYLIKRHGEVFAADWFRSVDNAKAWIDDLLDRGKLTMFFN